MPATGLVITFFQDLAIVTFEQPALTDARVIETLGTEIIALVDKQARRQIVLDFGRVRLLSSRMLGMLISLYKKSAAIKGRVILCGLAPALMEIFTITRMDKVMEFAEDQNKAMKLLGFYK
jgi:anti-sigma B factor antagonist